MKNAGPTFKTGPFLPVGSSRQSRVCPCCYDLASQQLAWGLDGHGYVQTYRGLKLHRLVLEAHGHDLTGLEGEHRDGDRTNNHIDNLRPATKAQNQYNIGLKKNNTSGYKGVARKRDKWRAYITVDKRRIHLGHFTTAQEAALAYNEAALKHCGEFARLNDTKRKQPCDCSADCSATRQPNAALSAYAA